MGNKVTTIIAEVEKARKGIATCAVLFLALCLYVWWGAVKEGKGGGKA